jgi:hypothetical protein
MVSRHGVTWRSPANLWRSRGGDAAEEPVLLSFDAERFMAELELLQTQAGHLADRVVGADAELLLAVHGKLHLAAASLVCEVPGWPDHTLSAAHEEKVGFVLRRSDPAEAWVASSSQWRAASSTALVTGEEVHPVSPLVLRLDGRPRRLHIGSIPTASRATFGAGEERRPQYAPRAGSRAQAFHLRFVFETERCGTLEQVLSPPTPDFTVATFFTTSTTAAKLPLDFGNGTTFETMAQYRARLG